MPPLLRTCLRLLLDDTPVAVRPDWLRRSAVLIGCPAFAAGVLAALLLLSRLPAPDPSGAREARPAKAKRAPSVRPVRQTGGRR